MYVKCLRNRGNLVEDFALEVEVPIGFSGGPHRVVAPVGPDLLSARRDLRIQRLLIQSKAFRQRSKPFHQSVKSKVTLIIKVQLSKVKSISSTSQKQRNIDHSSPAVKSISSKVKNISSISKSKATLIIQVQLSKAFRHTCSFTQILSI